MEMTSEYLEGLSLKGLQDICITFEIKTYGSKKLLRDKIKKKYQIGRRFTTTTSLLLELPTLRIKLAVKESVLLKIMLRKVQKGKHMLLQYWKKIMIIMMMNMI